jgi:glycosyltransferase involved in cell wall biosynthesis
MPFGTNLLINPNDGMGIKNAALQVSEALAAASIPYVLSDVTKKEIPLPYPINLIHIQPEGVIALARRRPHIFLSRHNAAYWNWETPNFPAQWMAALEWVDSVWVPSTFTANAVRSMARVPVFVVPYCVPQWRRQNIITRAQLGLSEKDYVFFLTFDGRSLPERKRPDIALRAFMRVAEKYRQARLIRKTARGVEA